jgi:leucyl aminopeptidase
MLITTVMSTTKVATKLRASSLRIEEWNNIAGIGVLPKYLGSAHETNYFREYRMDFELKKLSLSQAAAQSTGVLVVLLAKPDLSALAKAADPVSVLMTQAHKAGDFDASAGQLLQSYAPVGFKATRVMLAGIGEGAARDVGKAVAAAVSALKPASEKSGKKPTTTCLLWPGLATAQGIKMAMHAAASAAYSYDHTKSKKSTPKIASLTLAAANVSGLQATFDEARGCIAGVELAKEWGNRPANHATPTMLAEAAKQIAAGKSPVSCEVLGPKEVAKLKMGSFMAVAQGSAEPLRFIVLKYFGAAKSIAPTVLVGKGITFDTGGISIKPAGEMDEMKFDMCGAASVLGVFKALSVLKPRINVVGLIPSCENMPSSTAVKPGDVVTSMSGQTIEILNTDAEGRLILCDALTYAERFKPAAVVDIATLTGACVVALGAVRSGLFTSDDSLSEQLLAAGEATQDLAWRMPLDDDYAEGLKTNFADVANVAGRMGGAITAAKFLQRFTKAYPWAHLDIAGTAWKSGAAKGSTGRPVPLLLEFLLNFKQKQPLAGKKSA